MDIEGFECKVIILGSLSLHILDFLKLRFSAEGNFCAKIHYYEFKFACDLFLHKKPLNLHANTARKLHNISAKVKN